MTFASNGSEILAVLLRDLGRVHESVDKLTAKFNVLVGAAGAVGGGMILKGLWDTVKASEEWNRQLENTKALGGDIAAHFDAFKKRAVEVSTLVPTSTIAGNQKLLNELATQIGADNALTALPEAAKMQWLLQRDTGEGGKGGDIIDAIKTLDVRGQIFSKDASGKETVDIQKFDAELDALYKGYTVTRGLVSMKDFLHMAQQSGLAGKAMDREAFYVVNAELAAAMGAPKVGTAESSLASQMVGGVMPRRVAEEMTRLHLMNSSHAAHLKGAFICWVSPFNAVVVRNR